MVGFGARVCVIPTTYFDPPRSGSDPLQTEASEEAMRFADMLAQVLEEEIEYQPGYYVWQMEAEIRDQFVSILNAAKKASEVVDDDSR